MLALIMLGELRLICAVENRYATPTCFSNTYKLFKQIQKYV